MSLRMKREDVHSVKIYFVQPIDLIHVFINTMIELEYETYIISEDEREKLLEILPQDLRNIVFLCVANRHDVAKWLEYSKRLNESENSAVQIGAFVYTSMAEDIKKLFLYNLVSVTSFADLRTNAIEVFTKIFQAFDAKGNRKYIRVVPRDLSEAFVMVQNREEPVKGRIIDLSAAAFACEIDQRSHQYFAEPGGFFENVLLHIKGIRIRTAVKLLGFSKANTNVFIFKYYGTELKDGKISYTEKVSQEVKQKIHKYITSCLREDLKEKLAKIRIEKEKPKARKETKEADVEELEAATGELTSSYTEAVDIEEEQFATEGNKANEPDS